MRLTTPFIMRKKSAVLGAALAVIALTPMVTNAQTATPPGKSSPSSAIEIIDAGIYSLNVTGYSKAPQDVGEKRFNASNVKLIRKARVILAQPKLTFGFRFRLKDPSLIGKRLKLVIRFPRMTNPETRRSATQISDTFLATPGVQRELFRFDHTWEMAEGNWRFQILHKGKMIADEKFKVVIGLN